MIFSNNPFYDLKDKLTFDKLYSEKDFEKDCVWIQRIRNKELLTQESLVMLSDFWVRNLSKEKRNIKRIAKKTIAYMHFLRKTQKRVGLNQK